MPIVATKILATLSVIRVAALQRVVHMSTPILRWFQLVVQCTNKLVSFGNSLMDLVDTTT